MGIRTTAGVVSLVVLAGLTAGAATPQAAPLGAAPACPIFPADNVWNEDISALPVAANSATLAAHDRPHHRPSPRLRLLRRLRHPVQQVVGHPDQAQGPLRATPTSRTPGPYPIPAKPKIEGGGDRHLLIVDRDNCKLYELFDARHTSDAAGVPARARSGTSAPTRLRPNGWTSADAAGLPILPGLVRYDEVAAGVIDHALRFTAPQTRSGHIYPARHDAGSGTLAPPFRRWACGCG